MCVCYLSDDGYYSMAVYPPEVEGKWQMEAASISPYRGIQMAIPQTIIRRKPIVAKILGLPKVGFC